MKYKVLIALLFGSGAVSSICLLLNIHSLVVSVVASILLLPGGVLATFLFRASEITPPLAVLAGNALMYSAAAFIVLVVLPSSLSVAAMRLVTIRLTIPAMLLVGFACVPAFNPLWPRGMAELTKQEKGLQEALPLGMGLDQARAVLLSKRIRFQEGTESSETVVLKREDTSITAGAGERVMWGRLETDASQFPCGYDIEVVLVFGPDERIKDQYVHRSRVCP